MANRPAPANSDMLKPRSKKSGSAMTESKPKMAKMSNTTLKKTKKAGSTSKPISYAEARNRLKKMMRGGM